MGIIPQLSERGGNIGIFTRTGFQLDHSHWQTVEKNDKIGPSFLLFHEGPLVDQQKIVDVIVVDQFDKCGFFFPSQT